MNRILFDKSEWSPGSPLLLADERARHIVQVLRAVPGDSVKLGLLNGPLATGTVIRIGDGRVELSIELRGSPPPPPLDLLLALPRPKVLKRLLPQIAALGVGRLYLCNAARVERNYFDTHVLSPDVLRAALIEGLTQAGDTLLPEVRILRELKPFLEDELPELSGGMERLLFHPGSAEGTLFATPPVTARALVAIGPEGGWVPFELDRFDAMGFRRVTLCPRILRSDTAVIGALSLVSHWIRGS